MDIAKLRAWWSYRQGLDGALTGRTAREVLTSTGWARSVGGSGPYLGLFARAGLSRSAVDQEAAALEIQELPCARGCTYIVPSGDYALALAVGQGSTFEPEMKVARKLGVTDVEIERLCHEVLTAVKDAPLEPEEIRQRADGVVRSLGEEGKKKGVTTTLPLALARLQELGEIRRIPLDGRLDRQRYRYISWHSSPLAGSKLSKTDAFTELARRYFAWTGPATLKEFQTFSGLSATATKTAVVPLELRPITQGDERMLLPGDLAAFEEFTPPREPHYSLVSSLDSILLLRRNISDLLANEDHSRSPAGQKGTVNLGGLVDLPSHAILDRGRLVGMWEYDPGTASIAWTSFVGRNKELEAAVRRTEEYIRRDLEDARAFSLDSPKSRAPRIALLRGAGA